MKEKTKEKIKCLHCNTTHDLIHEKENQPKKYNCLECKNPIKLDIGNEIKHNENATKLPENRESKYTKIL